MTPTSTPTRTASQRTWTLQTNTTHASRKAAANPILLGDVFELYGGIDFRISQATKSAVTDALWALFHSDHTR